jgi:hypothetical protein
MRNKLTHVRANSIRPLLAATLALAITFTLSCSGGDDNEGGGGNNNNQFAGNPEDEWWKEYNKYYHPDEEFQQYDRRRCRNGVIEEPCEVDGNEVWYNSETQYCSYSYELDPNTGTSITTVTIEARERCGSKYIRPDYERCNNGVVERKCGDDDDNEAPWYNRKTHYCDEELDDASTWTYTYTIKALERCGNGYFGYGYKLLGERCNNGVIEDECPYIGGENATWYNIITHYCDHEGDYFTGYTGSTVKAKLRCGS